MGSLLDDLVEMHRPKCPVCSADPTLLGEIQEAVDALNAGKLTHRVGVRTIAKLVEKKTDGALTWYYVERHIKECMNESP